MRSNDISQSKRIIWLDNIRAIACVLVITLHVSAFYLYQFGKVEMLTWDIANIVNSATRSCVPLFFMISGYIFMRNKSMKVKNISKIITSLVFYSAISILYLILFKPVNISWTSLLEYLRKPAFYHLWFFYTILICYLFFALISVKNVSVTYALIFATIIFIFFNSRTASFTFLFFGFNYSGISVITSNVPFFIIYSALGAIIGCAETNKVSNKWFVIAFILLTLAISSLTRLLTIKNNLFTSDFYANESFVVMWASVCLFILIKNIKDGIPVFGRATKYIASSALPVYGFHALILDYINSEGLRMKNILLDLPLTILSVFILSLAIGVLITKIDKKGFIS